MSFLDRPAPVGSALLRRVAVLAGLLLVVGAWWQVSTADGDIEVVATEHAGVPITVLVPDGARDAPGVVVVHGLAGSGTLMRSFGLAHARAGSVVVLPDLPGHGTNREPLVTGDTGQLVAAVHAAVAVARTHPAVDPDAIVLVGHSMGAGAVLTTAIEDPGIAAGIVAVSPTDADVTPSSPPNLLLLAGEFEPRFVANAERLLERAGGVSEDLDAALDDGTARELAVVPSVEHVSVLFSPEAQRASVRWVATVTGRTVDAPAGAVPVGWWAAHLVGVVLLWRALVPVLVTSVPATVARGRPVMGAVAGGVVATLTLAGLDALLPLGSVGGMLVAPALALWFAVAGGVWLAIGTRPEPPDARDIGWAIGALGALVAAFGVLGPATWLAWWPIGPRAMAIGPLALLVLPWMVALAAAVQGRRRWRAAGWWVAASLVLVATLGAAANAVPALGFVGLLLPFLPALLALLVLVWTPLQRPWAAATAGALFLGWTMAVLFPLA